MALYSFGEILAVATVQACCVSPARAGFALLWWERCVICMIYLTAWPSPVHSVLVVGYLVSALRHAQLARGALH
ncbi:hypothetical protein GGR56DRAFT_660664 [Xylariaceae sp. FL0804]|nr:hypothetical protein GGR56DRAFT_660664 [Xylariaceae sp. FL0804]